MCVVGKRQNKGDVLWRKAKGVSAFLSNFYSKEGCATGFSTVKKVAQKLLENPCWHLWPIACCWCWNTYDTVTILMPPVPA